VKNGGPSGKKPHEDSTTYSEPDQDYQSSISSGATNDKKMNTHKKTCEEKRQNSLGNWHKLHTEQEGWSSKKVGTDLTEGAHQKKMCEKAVEEKGEQQTSPSNAEGGQHNTRSEIMLDRLGAEKREREEEETKTGGEKRPGLERHQLEEARRALAKARAKIRPKRNRTEETLVGPKRRKGGTAHPPCAPSSN